jgi:FixJ family two-component response regulator
MTELHPSTDATVVVVDDDPAIRRSISRLVRSVGYAVKTFGSPTDFLRHQLPDGPTCVLLDMCMNGMTGLEVQDVLRRNERQVPVVFLSGHGTVATAVTSVRHGAEDFLEKPIRPDELMEAVSRAIEHDRADSADRANRAGLRRRFERLTPREQEVMGLVVSGLLNKQTAAELGISERTIKVHRARVMEKMEVESLAALVIIAQRLGLAPAST